MAESASQDGLYTFNSSSGFVAGKPIYLVGILQSDGSYKLDNSSYTSFYTQTLPTTDDGKIYIHLGVMHNTTRYVRVHTDHPIYQFKDGKLRLYVPEHKHGNEDLPLSSTPINATELSSSVNLNALFQAGFYYQAANADTTGNNYPVDAAGSLLVQKSAGQVTQIYIVYSNGDIYTRSYYTSWSSWNKMYHTGNKPTPKDVDYMGAVANFDTDFKQGQYYLAGEYTGAPVSGVLYGKLIVEVSSHDTHNGTSNWVWQTLEDTSGRIWKRHKVNNGSWTTWRLWYNEGLIYERGTRVYSPNNKPSMADLGGRTASQITSEIATAIANLINSSPGALDTLDELAQALGDDPNFATTINTALGNRVVKNANITAGTKTKITYDAKGLVTDGADLVEADIPSLSPSKITQDANNRFVTYS
jgi:hypothetical protein